MIKKFISILLTLIMGLSFVSCKSKGNLNIYDSKGELIVTITDMDDIENNLEDKNEKSFIEFSVSEALGIIKGEFNCDSDRAEKILMENCSIYTSFDKSLYKCIAEHYNDNDIGKTPFGCVISDINGTVLATYSGGSKKENFATKKANPYSAFKPLSVYAPALDENLICWSDTYKDSPYKTISSKESKSSAWPQNADGKYSMTDVCISEGIKKSLNTVAVKCLADYGVMKSIAFLQNNLGLKLEDEQKKATMSDPDEIIGNVAMGYISEGCSPVDMAGYYQIFVNGGKYTLPHCITKIVDSNEKEVYIYNPETKPVIKETTSFIMNKLLQGVVQNGGTGKAAHINGVLVGGKTGTGVTDDGNWFVGFTPEYVCSVWHGSGMPKNTSPEIFSSVMTDVIKIHPTKAVDFPSASGIKQEAFCAESGKLLKYSCRKMEIGYYVSENIPDVCEIH